MGVHLWRPRRGLPPPPAGCHPIGGNGVPVLALGWLWFLPAGVWKDPPGSALPTQFPFPRLPSPGGFLLEASCSPGAALGTPVLGHHPLWEEPGRSTARRPLTVPGCLWPPSRERVFVCTRVGARVNTHAPRALDTGQRAGMRGQQALQNPRGQPQPRKTQSDPGHIRCAQKAGREPRFPAVVAPVRLGPQASARLVESSGPRSLQCLIYVFFS